jgi:hypothetical protein
VHRRRDLGHGRTLAFERDIHGGLTGAYVAHYDGGGRACLTRLAVEAEDRPGGRRAYRILSIDPVTLEGPLIVCDCGLSGRILDGRWIPEGAGGPPPPETR